MRTLVTGENVRRPTAPYSPGIIVNGLLFTAGQGPFDINGVRVGETFEEQALQTFQNLEAVANAAGTSLKHAVRIGVYLRTLDDHIVMGEISKEFFVEPFPVRTTIQADLRGFDIEVDAVIAIPDE